MTSVKKASRRTKKKNTKNELYQELHNDILNSVALSTSRQTNANDIKEYLLNILPTSDTQHIDTDLKSIISIKCDKTNIPKLVRPRARKTVLSQKSRRNLGLYNLPKVAVTYNEAKVMNKMWENYMSHNLDLKFLNKQSWHGIFTGCIWESVSSSLLKADYHGALVKVMGSKCPSLVGHCGIIIFDTKYTFKIVGTDNVVRTIPKESCVFEFKLDKYKFKIFGKYFCMRNSERPTKKIKSSFIPVL